MRGIRGTRAYIIAADFVTGSLTKVRQSCGEVGATMRWLGIHGSEQKTQRGVSPDGNSARVSSVPRRHLWMPLETLIVLSAEKFARRCWRGELYSKETCGATQDAGDETEMPLSVNFSPEGNVMLVQLPLLAVSDLDNWKLEDTLKTKKSCEKKDNKSIIFHKARKLENNF